jgi:hypothetical protein
MSVASHDAVEGTVFPSEESQSDIESGECGTVRCHEASWRNWLWEDERQEEEREELSRRKVRIIGGMAGQGN